MSNPQLLITIIVLQQGLIGLMWLGAALTGLARGSAWHWGASALCMALCLMLVTGRGDISPWLGFALANSCGVAAMALLRRGVQRFCDVKVGDAEHLAVITLAAVALCVAVQRDAAEYVPVVIISAGMAWSLLRAAFEVAARLRFEVGGLGALGFATPMALVGAAFLLRALLAPVLSDDVGRSIVRPGGANVAFGLFVLAAMLSLHFGLAAMVVLRMVRRLRHLSDHDELTGLLNRRGFEQLLGLESERLRRYQQPFALLSVDIDHFKKINDRFGHDVGDQVLAAVAQSLAGGLRDVDRIGRVGGEEFCILMPHTDIAGAEHAALRLVEAVRDRAYRRPDVAIAVTVSIGAAVAADPQEDRSALMRRLDRALYRAKEGGRDRIELATVHGALGRLASA